MPVSLTRRMALKNLALAGAGLTLLPTGLCAATTEPVAKVIPPPASPLPFELGVASYSLRGLPIEAALRAVRRVGLKNISINRLHLPWENPAPGWTSVLEKFQSTGVAARCCGVIYLKNDEAAVRNACEYTRALGVSLLACSPDLDALPLLERYLKQYDLRAAIHNHGPEDKIWPTAHEIWRAIQPFDERIGICLDVGHNFRAGADPTEAIYNYRSRMYDIHLKDTIAPVGTDDIPIEIGRGVIDQRPILKALIEIGYREMVWFEYEKDADDPLPGLAESVGYIKGLLKNLASPPVA